MKPSTFSLLLVLIVLSFSLLPLLTSAARPCKSIFITSYTVTTPTSSTRYFTVYRIIPRQTLPDPTTTTTTTTATATSSSFQERAKDILSVVAGLLFGFGCGAITAATAYMLWSMITGNCNHAGEEEEEEEPKKMGYVMIADVAATVEKEGIESGK